MSCLDVMYQVFGPQPYFSSYGPYHHQVRRETRSRQLQLLSPDIPDAFTRSRVQLQIAKPELQSGGKFVSQKSCGA